MISYANKDDKKRIIIAAFITMLCVIIAVAQPLNVAAQEVDAPFSDLGAVAVGMLAGGFASYAVTSWAAAAAAGATTIVLGGVAIPTAIVILVIGVLVAVGVTLTVTAIIHALNEYYNIHTGDCQLFIDKIVDGFKNGMIDLRNKITLHPTIFNYVYDWVKTNVLGYYDTKTSNINLGAAVDGFELYQPNYVFDHIPTTNDLNTYYNYTNYYDKIIVNQSQISDLSTGQTRDWPAAEVTVVNENTNADVLFSGKATSIKNRYSFGSDIWQTFKIDDNFTYSKKFHAQYTDTGFVGNSNYYSYYYLYMPYVYENNNNNYLSFYCEWVSNLGTASGSDEHYINDQKIHVKAGEGTVFNENETIQYRLKFPNNEIKQGFDGMNNFLYYLFCKSCTLIATTVSNNESTEANNTTIVYNTTNNYYNEKRDTLKRTADTVAGKVHDGTITDESEGSISIGFTDTTSIPLTSDLADTVPATDVIGISEVSTTDVVTDGSTVMEGSAVVSVAAALIIGGNHIRSGLSTITLKFPFDVIPNVRNFLNKLVREGEPLVIDYDIVAPHIGTFPVHIDFNKYSTIITVFRWVVLVSLAIGLLIASKYALQLI